MTNEKNPKHIMSVCKWALLAHFTSGKHLYQQEQEKCTSWRSLRYHKLYSIRSEKQMVTSINEKLRRISCWNENLSNALVFCFKEIYFFILKSCLVMKQTDLIHCRHTAFWCGKAAVQVLPDNPWRLITRQFVWVPRDLWRNPELPGYKAILPSGSAVQWLG